MIHNNSGDPVFIKKIPLRIWTLRDEIEAVLKEKVVKGSENLELKDLIDEYTTRGPGDSAEVFDISPDEPSDDESAMAAALSDDESEMAAALSDDASEMETALSKDDAEMEEENISDENPSILDENSSLVQIFQRTPNIPTEKVCAGKAVLSEINMDEMFFFSNQSFMSGQSIVIEFVVPKRFVANAIVSFCRNYNLKSRVISPNRLAYRIGIKFSFLKKGERTLLRQFISSIEPEFERITAEEVDTNEPAEGDSFDELDDLDL